MRELTGKARVGKEIGETHFERVEVVFVRVEDMEESCGCDGRRMVGREVKDRKEEDPGGGGNIFARCGAVPCSVLVVSGHFLRRGRWSSSANFGGGRLSQVATANLPYQ